MKRTYWLIIAVIVLALIASFPMTERCFSSQACNQLLVTDNRPGHLNACAGKVMRPLTARLLGKNWHYRVDTTECPA
jgi:hypothetical protein